MVTRKAGSRHDDGDDGFRPVTIRKATTVRDVISSRRSRDAKDEMTKGAVKKLDAQGAVKGSSGKKRSYRKQKEQDNEGSTARKLVHWSPYIDQRLMLIMVYELRKLNIEIPFDAIAKRLYRERVPSIECIKQHLDKVRSRMLHQGCWVPPLIGRGHGTNVRDVRGVVHVQDDNGNWIEKNVEWEDDVSSYLEPNGYEKDISQIKVCVPTDRLNPWGLTAEERKVKQPHNYPANRAKYNSNKVALASTRDTTDAIESDLGEDGDTEYQPSTNVKKLASSKAKSNAPTREGGRNNDKRMMSPFGSGQEQDSARKTVTISLHPSILAWFPAGTSGPEDDEYEPNDVVPVPEEGINAVSLLEDLGENMGGIDGPSVEADSVYLSSIIEHNETFPSASDEFAPSDFGPTHVGIKPDRGFVATSEYAQMAPSPIGKINPHNTAGLARKFAKYYDVIELTDTHDNRRVMTDEHGLPTSTSVKSWDGQEIYADMNGSPGWSNEMSMTSGASQDSNYYSQSVMADIDSFHSLLNIDNFNSMGDVDYFDSMGDSQTIDDSIDPNLDISYSSAPGYDVLLRRAEAPRNDRLVGGRATQHEQTGADLGVDTAMLTEEEDASNDQLFRSLCEYL